MMSKRHLKNRKKGVFIIIFLIALLVFIYSVWNIYLIFQAYNNGKKNYDSIRNLAFEVNDNHNNPYKEKVIEDNMKLPINFVGLKKLNEDCIGWIEFEGIDLSYPITQGRDNQFYLSHNFKKDKSIVGCIFMDMVNSTDFMDINTVLYGHNMKDGSMFAKLNSYKDKSFFLNNPHFYIYTPKYVYCYEIFSCYFLKISDNSLEQTTSEFDITENSLYDTGIIPKKKDKILTLITCNSTGEDYRFFVHARQAQVFKVKS